MTKMQEWIERGLARKGRNAAADLARALGVTPDKVSRMRRGERKPTLEELPVIEAFLGERAPGRPADDNVEHWIAVNLHSARKEAEQALQQTTLHYLIYYVSRIGDQLERIAQALEAQSRPSGAETMPADRRPSRSMGRPPAD